MTHCPACGEKLGRSSTLIEGSVIVWCPACRRKAALIEGVAEAWIPDGPDQTTLLGITIRDGHRWKALVDADAEDPRWQAWM